MKEYNEDFIQYSDKKGKAEEKNLALYFAVHISLYIILFFFLLFFAWYTVFISTHRFYEVYGLSMKGALNSEISDYAENPEDLSFDAVYIDKYGALRLNDIVVIKNNSKSVVKRLLAFEGDYITIAKTKNDQNEDIFSLFRIEKGADLTNFSDEEAKVDEISGQNGYQIYNPSEWLAMGGTAFSAEGKTNTYEARFFNKFLANYGQNGYEYKTIVSENGLIYVQVPEGKAFYLGDNRAHSKDARDNGFCERSQIVGRCEFVVNDYNFGKRILSVIKFYFAQVEDFFAR